MMIQSATSQATGTFSLATFARSTARNSFLLAEGFAENADTVLSIAEPWEEIGQDRLAGGTLALFHSNAVGQQSVQLRSSVPASLRLVIAEFSDPLDHQPPPALHAALRGLLTGWKDAEEIERAAFRIIVAPIERYVLTGVPRPLLVARRGRG
jgi:hypothetical protein